MTIRLPAESWPDRAACRGDDTDLWFPPGTGDPDPHAKAVCGLCRVSADCLDYAIVTRQQGYWGGMSEDERQSERRRRQRRGAAA